MTSILHPALYYLFPQEGILTTRAHGIDISKYDLEFHPELATAQLDFVIQRISYGITRDEAYFTLLPGVKNVAIRLGYHYLSSWFDYRTQADAFLRYIEGTEYHAFVCDFEGTANTLSIPFAKTCWDFMNYVEQKTSKEVILYTGKYLYQDWLTPSQSRYGINWNGKKLWIAQYPFIPNPDGQPSLPAGRTGWSFWQYTDKGDGTKYGAGRSTACDLDVFNGTVEQLKTLLKISSIPNDEYTPLYNGIEQYSGIRNGYKFWIQIINPAKVTYELYTGMREKVSDLAMENGAALATNGGDWDRISGEIKHPPFAPTILFHDGSIEINHEDNQPVDTPHIHGVRYIVKDSIIPSYLDGSEPQYTEGHSRTIEGITAEGKHIQMITEGVYPNQGMTLKQCAEIAKQHGAVQAFDSGGGGDTTLFVNDIVLNKPEDKDAQGNNIERYIPQILLIYPRGDNMYGTAKEKLGNVSKKRSIPSRYGTDMGSIPAGSTIDFVQVVPVQVQGTADNPNDQWFLLPDNTYVNYILSGTSYYTILTQSTAANPVPDYITAHFTDGTTKKYLPE